MNKTDLINAVAEQADLTKRSWFSSRCCIRINQNSLAKGEKYN